MSKETQPQSETGENKTLKTIKKIFLYTAIAGGIYLGVKWLLYTTNV